MYNSVAMNEDWKIQIMHLKSILTLGWLLSCCIIASYGWSDRAIIAIAIAIAIVIAVVDVDVDVDVVMFIVHLLYPVSE